MRAAETAKAYAAALYELGESAKADISKEMTDFTEIINGCNDLENVLFLDVFTIEEKTAVLDGISGKVKFSELFKNFLAFLLDQNRMSLYPIIFKEMVVIDDHKKGFIRGTIESGEANIDEGDKKLLTSFIEKKTGKKASLDYHSSDAVTAGYRVTVGDLQLDASIDKQFDNFKHTILGEHA